MSGRVASALVLGSLVGSLLLGGCVPATPDEGTYKDKAALTLGGALSEVATVQKVLETLHEDKMFRPTAITQMRYSGSSLDTNASAFDEVQPPPDLDWLHKKTDDLLSEAQDTTLQARIAIERNETARYPAIAEDLGKLADELDKLETRVS